MNLLVTAGPTREAIDPVRFLSNRSSGKMGYAVARAAAERGHDVRLISGPVALPVPGGVPCRPVVSAEEMLAAVREDLPWCDALVMAAAVADWRPAACAAEKLKKSGRDELMLRLVRTPDVLEAIAPLKGARTYVGFAAETGRLEEEARGKLRAKRLDLIVANDITQPGAGFEVDTNLVLLLYADGRRDALPLLSKADVAAHVIDAVETLRGRR